MYVPGPPYQRRLRAVRTRGAGPLAPRLPTRCVWPCAWPCASGAPATRRAPGPLAPRPCGHACTRGAGPRVLHVRCAWHTAGEDLPDTRAELWRRRRLIFCTPHILRNDLDKRLVDGRRIALRQAQAVPLFWHPSGTLWAPPWHPPGAPSGTLWHPLGSLWHPGAPFGHPLGTLWQGPSSAPAGASSGRAWWLWAARYPQVEAGPLGAPPHCRGCASEPPPKPPPTPPPKPPISPPISPPLPRQVLAIFDEAHHAASEGDPCAALLTTYYLLLTTDY